MSQIVEILKAVKKPRIWTDEVRRAWELPERLMVSQWADRSRVLDAANAEPGPWHTDRTPYLRGIMDAFNDPYVEDITIMASTQCGKTEAMLNMMGFAVDQDPGPMLLVMPREDDAKSISSKRIIPMLRISPDLRSHFTVNSDDITKMEISLDRMTIFLSGANSPAGLSQRPIRYLFLDETDKYPAFAGKESDPIKLATERTRTFWNRKIVKCSTPTNEDGYIFREYERSDMRKFYVPCPFCGKAQVLSWPQVKWPEDVRDPEEVKLKRLAWYECINCKERIVDGMKQRMLLQGEWIAENFTGDGSVRRTSRVGFWINAIYSPWLSFSEIASEWLNSYQKPELLMNFVNSWLAEPWRENIGRTQPDEIRRLARPYQAGVVPDGVLVLTGGVDVQKDHFYVVIRGWGYLQESWLVLATRLESWEDVVSVMCLTNYEQSDPNLGPLPVRLTCIDTGYRTSEVYEVCREWRDITRPIKGRDQLGGVPMKVSSLDKFPSGQLIPGGLQLWHLDTSYFKDKVMRLVKNTAADTPAGWHIYQNPADDYVKQFCGEAKVIVRDKKTRRVREEWRPVSTHAASHYFDAEVYATAGAEMLRVFDLREKGLVVHQANPGDPRQFKHENWINRQANWMKRNG